MLFRLRSKIRGFLSAPVSTRDLDSLRAQIGSHEARIVRNSQPDRLRDAEFRVFSQFGEDGIIQYLVGFLDIPEHAQKFVEFGVESYQESNTRFLLLNDNWAGLVLDGGDSHLTFIESRGLRWRYTIDAVKLFIDRENLGPALANRGFDGLIGLLSIDIDGNDYWIWESLRDVNPIIVVVEYNSVFGPSRAVSVPYDPTFQRGSAHWSHLYWGASLGALVHLGRMKGYRFVGSNSAGNNAFFVAENFARDLPDRLVEDEWVRSRFRESRNQDGQLTYITDHFDRLAVISHLPLVDVKSGERCTVADVL